MHLLFLVKGMIIGFLVAAPIGPIGSLCINRTLSSGRTSGFISGLGVALADGFYGAVAAYGLTMISGFLLSHQFWFRLAGSVFLLYIGVKVLLSKPLEGATARGGKGLAADLVSAFFLTLTNPVTILLFAAIFANLGLGTSGRDFLPATMMVAGVFLGSALCWFILSGLVSIFRDRFQAAALRIVYRISGSVILIFAGAMLVTVLIM